MIKSKKLNVHLIRKEPFEGVDIRLDWRALKLAMYNVV